MAAFPTAPLTARFGTEIVGLDTTAPCSAEALAE